MKILNTTPEKQQNLINFANDLGVSFESVQKMFQDPRKASVLNMIAQGL